MVIIEYSKSEKQPFKVRYTSEGNNKNLAPAETLTTKKNCWKNIYSMYNSNFKCIGGEVEIPILDTTVPNPEVFVYDINGIKKKAGIRK